MGNLTFRQQLFIAAFSATLSNNSGMAALERVRKQPIEELVAALAWTMSDAAVTHFEKKSTPAPDAARPVVPQPTPRS